MVLDGLLDGLLGGCNCGFGSSLDYVCEGLVLLFFFFLLPLLDGLLDGFFPYRACVGECPVGAAAG